MEFGEGLALVRATRGLSQTALARRLAIAPSTVSAYELGVRSPKVEDLDRICDALGVEKGLLFDDERLDALAKVFNELEQRKANALREAVGIIASVKKGGASRVTNRAQSEPPSTLSANYHSVKRTLQEVIPPATRRTASIPR